MRYKYEVRPSLSLLHRVPVLPCQRKPDASVLSSAVLQIWRPWTAFFFGGSGFPLIYDFFLIYRNGSSLEKDT